MMGVIRMVVVMLRAAKYNLDLSFLKKRVTNGESIDKVELVKLAHHIQDFARFIMEKNN